MQPIESSTLDKRKSLEKLKHYSLTEQQLRKEKEQLTAKRNKHANPMMSSSSSGACFSPTHKSKLGSDLLLQQRKQNKPRKVKSETLQAKHITHEVIKI